MRAAFFFSPFSKRLSTHPNAYVRIFTEGFAPISKIFVPKKLFLNCHYIHNRALETTADDEGKGPTKKSALSIEERKQEAELRKVEAEAEAAIQRTKAEAEAAIQRAKAEAEAAIQRAKAEAAMAEMAVLDAEERKSDAKARKSASETFLGKLSTYVGQSVATRIAAVVAFLGILMTFVLTLLREDAQAVGQAEAVEKFDRRRIDAIKERILSPHILLASQQNFAFLDLFSRPQALKELEYMSTKAGIYMVVGPKGEGKTTLVSQFVSSHPHVLYANLQEGSMDKAVRAVAASLGYDMNDNTEEAHARQRGYKLPDLQSPQSTDTYETLLKAFEVACVELRSEDKLVPGHSPVLVLDHANRPLRRSGNVPLNSVLPALDALTPSPAAIPVSTDANLMYSTVEMGHMFANKSIASLVMVSSDLLQELDAWKRAGGRDSVRYIRVAPFSEEEAANLLSRRIFSSRDEKNLLQHEPPSPEDHLAIQRDYSSTISTIISTIGTRARWLVQSLQHEAQAPLTDAELPLRGMPIPEHYFPYLPNELRDRNIRVDPKVWVSLQSLIESRKMDANALLNVSTNFSIPMTSLSDSWAIRFAERIVAVDSALRALLIAPLPHSDLEKRFFASAEQIPRRLAEQHVIFYNHDNKHVEIESPLVSRIVSAILSSKDHELSMHLVRHSLAWQAAALRESIVEKQMALENRSGSSHSPRVIALESELDTARNDVKQLLQSLKTTRDELREMRRVGFY